MPRVVDHEARRREIAEAIWYVTAREGLEAVTLRSVAAAAGISVGRIQHYFANKEAMLRYGCHAMIAVAEETYEADASSAEPLAAFRGLVTHAIPVSEVQKLGTAVWYAYLAHSVNDSQIAAVMSAAKGEEENEGVRLLQAAQDMGHAESVLDTRRTVRSVLALADGLALRVFIGQLDSAAALGVLERELKARL